jgi:hypothetical protein
MSTEIKNPAIKPVKPAAKPENPAAAGKPDKPKKPDPGAEKPKAQLHKVEPYPGTVGQYGANPEGVYDRFTLLAEGAEYTVKFPPHFGQALHAAAQPGAVVTVLGFSHTTPKGDAHLHLASLEVGGQHLRPLPPGAEPVAVQGLVTELLRDPKGQLRGLRLADEAAELRLPPHLSEQLADYLVVGAAVAASGQRRSDHPGEVRAPGHPAPVQLTLLTVGGESLLIE